MGREMLHSANKTLPTQSPTPCVGGSELVSLVPHFQLPSSLRHPVLAGFHLMALGVNFQEGKHR